jgi:hypothetical protein
MDDRMDEWTATKSGATVALSDEELTALALAEPMDAPPDPDAVAWTGGLVMLPGILPTWYMPPAMSRRLRRWQIPLVVAVIAAFLIIDAFGLCSTYG